MKIHGFDILLGSVILTSFFCNPHSRLDVLLVNQTGETMQNLCLDLSTLGDLKLVERPSVHTLAPHNFLSVKASIKVGVNIYPRTYLQVSRRSPRQRRVSFSAIFSGKAPAPPRHVSS